MNNPAAAIDHHTTQQLSLCARYELRFSKVEHETEKYSIGKHINKTPNRDDIPADYGQGVVAA